MREVAIVAYADVDYPRSEDDEIEMISGVIARALAASRERHRLGKCFQWECLCDRRVDLALFVQAEQVAYILPRKVRLQLNECVYVDTDQRRAL